MMAVDDVEHSIITTIAFAIWVAFTPQAADDDEGSIFNHITARQTIVDDDDDDDEHSHESGEAR